MVSHQPSDRRRRQVERARPGPCLPGIPGKEELHCSGGEGGGATPELLNNVPSVPPFQLCLHPPPIREHVCNCDLTSTFHLVSIEINRHFSHARPMVEFNQANLALTHTRGNIIKSGCRAAFQQSLIIMLLLSYDHNKLILFQCTWD